MFQIFCSSRFFQRLLFITLFLFIVSGDVYSISSISGNGLPRLFLNEIVASNSTGLTDEDGEYHDWIELYYDGDEPLSLYQYGLTDDLEEPFQWLFPDTTIRPGEFLVIMASGKDRAIAGKPLHTSFRIDREGEDILLSHPILGLVDSFEARRIPTDHSAGRVPDGFGEWFYFDQPTPGGPNHTPAYEGFAGNIHFSHPPGFHTDDFHLEMWADRPGDSIYYTLDGSLPDTNSSLYEDSLLIYDRSSEENVFSTVRTSHRTFDWRRWYKPREPVAKATVLRTRTHRAGHLPVYDKKTFFVFPDGSDTYEIPVISIATDSLNLFDYETGIYIPGIHYTGSGGTGNEFQRGMEWEREATFEFFKPEGERALHQDIGIRIHGGFSRQLAQKSLRLYARSQYGESRFNHPFFEERSDSSFNRLILRNSGNTWGEDMFMDAAAQSLVRHFNMDTQAYRPSVLFLNGEFWGIHNIRERYDRHYLERVYDIDPDHVDILTGHREVKEGDTVHYDQLLALFRQNDMSDPGMLERAATKMDLDNFLDYYTAQIYFGNNDWPHNNIDYWRLRVPYQPGAPPGHDGRWRWMLFDVDRSLGHETGPEFNMIEWLTREINPRVQNDWPNLIFRSLLASNTFTHDFLNRMADHLNSSFLPDRVSHVIDSLSLPVASVIAEHIDRWSLPASVTAWEGFVDEMHRYAEERPGYLRSHLMEHFSIADTHRVTLDVQPAGSGTLRINHLDIATGTPGIPADPYPWTGVYFHDIPATLQATGHSGNTFHGWLINGQQSESANSADSLLTLQPDSPVQITALFTTSSGQEYQDELPDQVYLHHGYPNPFNASTILRFELPARSEIRLSVYDMLGRSIRELANEVREAGTHEITFHADDLATGVYIVRLHATGDHSTETVLTRKITLIR